MGLELGQILEQSPAQVFLQVLPQAFNRIQLRTVRWLKEQDDIVGNHEGFGFVKRPVIDLQNIERIGIGLRELVEKKLIAVAINMGKLQKELLSSRWFYRTIDPKSFELPLPTA